MHDENGTLRISIITQTRTPKNVSSNLKGLRPALTLNTHLHAKRHVFGPVWCGAQFIDFKFETFPAYLALILSKQDLRTGRLPLLPSCSKLHVVS